MPGGVARPFAAVRSAVGELRARSPRRELRGLWASGGVPRPQQAGHARERCLTIPHTQYNDYKSIAISCYKD